MLNITLIPIALGLGLPELVIILAIVIVLFGASKIPQLMRGVGRGITEFKQGVNEGKEIESSDEKKKELSETKKEQETQAEKEETNKS